MSTPYGTHAAYDFSRRARVDRLGLIGAIAAASVMLLAAITWFGVHDMAASRAAAEQSVIAARLSATAAQQAAEQATMASTQALLANENAPGAHAAPTADASQTGAATPAAAAN